MAAALIIAGAALVAFAATRTWWTAEYADTPVGPYRTSATGSDTLPELIPVALVALAGWGAALATRGTWRRVIGGLVAAVGAVVSIRVGLQWADPPLDQLGRTPFLVGAPVDPTRHPLPMLTAAIGGLLVLAGGILLILGATGRQLSSRYERSPGPASAAPPRAPGADDGADLWKALDSGVDPTASEPVSEAPPTDDYHESPSGIPGDDEGDQAR